MRPSPADSGGAVLGALGGPREAGASQALRSPTSLTSMRLWCRHEITAGLVGGDLAAGGRVGLSFGSQRATCGDVPEAGPGCQPLALRALAGAWGSEQQQPHRMARSAGMTISRFWILPVGPLGSASTIHT